MNIRYPIYEGVYRILTVPVSVDGKGIYHPTYPPFIGTRIRV